MSNFVFYDFETSSSNKYWGQIIQIGAVLTNDNLDELDRFDARCRLSPGIIPEAMALIVNKSTPKMLKESNLSHYEMIRQFVETLKVQQHATQIYSDLRNISSRFDKHFDGIKDLRKKLEQAMTATDGFGRDARSIMNTLSNIKDPQQVKETLEENPEKIKVLK